MQISWFSFFFFLSFFHTMWPDTSSISLIVWFRAIELRAMGRRLIINPTSCCSSWAMYIFMRKSYIQTICGQFKNTVCTYMYNVRDLSCGINGQVHMTLWTLIMFWPNITILIKSLITEDIHVILTLNCDVHFIANVILFHEKFNLSHWLRHKNHQVLQNHFETPWFQSSSALM